MNIRFVLSLLLTFDRASNIRASEIWGEILAFVDVNYDRFTDLIVKRDQLLVVYRSITEEADLKFTERSKFVEDPSYNNDFTTKGEILNVAAGDFNADSYPDLLVSTMKQDNSHGAVDVTICWGSDKSLTCDFSHTYTFKQQPIILNCDDDTITDFMAVNLDGQLLCYQGKKSPPKILDPVIMSDLQNITLLNSGHAFVDLTGDFNADLVLQVDPKSAANVTRAPIHPNLPVYQIYSRQGPDINWKMDPDVQPSAPPPFPYSQDFAGSSNPQTPDLFSLSDRFTVGHPIFDDFNRDGFTDLLTPVCQGPTSNRCQKFWLLVWSSGQRSWFWLSVENFHNLALGQAGSWTFPQHFSSSGGEKANSDDANGIDENLVVRSGDYTQNGFPDILVVLAGSKNKSQAQAFFIENVPCVSPSQMSKNCTSFGRTFALSFTPLTPCAYVKTATFFDLGEDGTLDLLYECRNDTKPLDKFGYKAPPKYNIEFTNWNTDHDTTFLKVQTYTATCNYCPGGKEGTGISWPGVSLTYAMVDTEGQTVSAAYTQQSRTSHKSLLLPYALFGLGRSPNFVETMNIGVPQFPGAHQTWQQIVPNSRMYVVPYPAGEPSHWVGRLYVTPSRLILLSVSALGGVCLLILIMVIILQCYEMKQDRKERDVLKKRFHFDAM